MLRSGVVFLVVALIAGFLGYGGVASFSYDGAKVVFVVFLILAMVAFVGHAVRHRPFWE